MKNRIKYFSIFALVIAIAAVLTTNVFASSPIDSLFSDMKAELSKPGDLPDTNVIAKVGSKEITYKEFRDYKENLKMMAKKGGATFNRDNQDVFNDMVKRQLTVQYAINKGIVVSDEEVQSYANEQRKALQTAPEETKEVLKNLIEKSGLPEDEYWKSSTLLAAYRDWIIINKLIESDSSIETAEKFSAFQDSLLQNPVSTVLINKQNFEAIK